MNNKEKNRYNCYRDKEFAGTTLCTSDNLALYHFARAYVDDIVGDLIATKLVGEKEEFLAVRNRYWDNVAGKLTIFLIRM